MSNVIQKYLSDDDEYVRNTASNLSSVLLESNKVEQVDVFKLIDKHTNVNPIDDLLTTTDRKKLIRKKIRGMRVELLNSYQS